MGRRWGYFIGLGLIGLVIGLFVWFNWELPQQNCAGVGGNDLGDAPDGQATGYPPAAVQIGTFPSATASGGPTASVGCNVWIGEKVTGETDYTDPADPDPIHRNPRPPGTNVPNSVSDYDDGVGWVWRPDPSAGPSGLPADLVVSVEISSQQGGQYIINVLQDHNMDGDWAMDSLGTGGGEWAVVNHHVTVAAGHSTVDLPPIRFPTPFVSTMPECFWMRVALTDTEIQVEDEFGWNGTGPLGEGEIEDHLVHPTLRAGNCISPQPVN